MSPRRPSARSQHSRRRVLAGAIGIAAAAVAVVGGVQLLRPTSTPMALAGDSSAMASTAPPSGSAGDGAAGGAGAVPVPPSPEAAAPAPTPAPMLSATYTVQPGDTLSAIAAWFKLHGYSDLYQANKAAIGANPDLIYPGQTITLSAAGVTMGR